MTHISLTKSKSTDYQIFAEMIAEDLNEMLYTFHQYDQPYDDEMDAELHEQYARVLREQLGEKDGWRKFLYGPDGERRPTFGPSAAGNSDREVYEKAVNGSKAADPKMPTANQRDWTGLGSQVGDYIQREILLIERHYEKLTGKKPKFRFERTDRGEPAFEHFKKKIHEVEFDGERFGINGLPDGILIYTANDGVEYRVGLEVKSFQKSYTEFKKLSEPKDGHVLQTYCYSEMYDLDYYVILNHLTYGVDWTRELNRNKTFGLYITDREREIVLSKFARVTKAWREKTPPEIDLLTDWQYNDFKRMTALSMTDEEIEGLKRTFLRIKRSSLADWKKQRFHEALEFIEKVREGEAVH